MWRGFYIDFSTWFGLPRTSLVAQMVKRLSTMWETWVPSRVRKIRWRRKWQSTSVLLPGESHGQRSLVGYSPWGHKEWDTTEQLHFPLASQYLQRVGSWLSKVHQIYICSAWISVQLFNNTVIIKNFHGKFFQGNSPVVESTCHCRRCGFDPWVSKFPWRRKWQPTVVFLPEKSHRQRRLVGYSLWGCKESEQLNKQKKSILNLSSLKPSLKK